jgi:hypothetical protein
MPPPPNAYNSLFHEMARTAASPMVRSFTGTIEIGFTVTIMDDVNVSTLIKRCLSFALNMDTDFLIQPLQGGDQSIAWPNGTPATKEGIYLYFQHKVIKDGVRGKINVKISKSISQMKEANSIFRSNLDKEKVYLSQTSLGLVDAHLIGVFLQADPNLTFCNDRKQAIMNVMENGTPISVFLKRVKDDASKVRYTNGLAVQVAIPDSKKAAEYTETLTKAMAYFNENDSHPIISSKVCLPFGKVAAIDNSTFRKLIRMQNEYVHEI